MSSTPVQTSGFRRNTSHSDKLRRCSWVDAAVVAPSVTSPLALTMPPSRLDRRTSFLRGNIRCNNVSNRTSLGNSVVAQIQDFHSRLFRVMHDCLHRHIHDSEKLTPSDVVVVEGGDVAATLTVLDGRLLLSTTHRTTKVGWAKPTSVVRDTPPT